MTSPRRQLVILQQSPFCNINCEYCYLPHRQSKARMSKETLEKIYHSVFKSEKLRDPITFLWHAGEPLAVGHAFFRQALELSFEINQIYQRHFIHNIQTNATLIDQEWIDLFKQYRVLIGVSLDGPQFIHDQQRVTRAGKGTFDKVMRGVRLLQDNQVPFEVIMVLTNRALDYPDEIFHFFVEQGIKGVGFNIDELEGSRTTSSYLDNNAQARYQKFMSRFLELVFDNPGVLGVREFRSIFPVFAHPEIILGNGEGFNNTNVPLQLLTINYQGDYSTFCPELSGARSEQYHNFVMGNVFTQPIDQIFNNPIFQMVNAEVQAGVELCRSQCAYWNFCGGGAPANKFFETGQFNTSETMHCKIQVQTLAETIITFLENKVNKQEVIV